MIEFQFRVFKPVTIWSEIAVREKSRGGVRSAATAAGAPMSTALRDGIQRLEVTSRVTIGVLALASGVDTYLGVRELLNGNTTTVFFAAGVFFVGGGVRIFSFLGFSMGVLSPRLRF